MANDVSLSALSRRNKHRGSAVDVVLLNLRQKTQHDEGSTDRPTKTKAKRDAGFFPVSENLQHRGIHCSIAESTAIT